MLAFLASSVGRYILIAAAFFAVLFGVFEWGHSVGREAGYQEAWNVQQKTINKMVDDENAQVQANNKKIADIEADSFKATFQNRSLQAQLVQARTKIAEQYAQSSPQSAQSCGFDIQMVQEINELIQADPSNSIGDQK